MKWRPFCDDCGWTSMYEKKNQRYSCSECNEYVELREVE